MSILSFADPPQIALVHRTLHEGVAAPRAFDSCISKASMDCVVHTPHFKLLKVGINLLESRLPSHQSRFDSYLFHNATTIPFSIPMSTAFSHLFASKFRSRKSIHKCLQIRYLQMGLVPYYKYSIVLTQLLLPPSGEGGVARGFLLEDFFTFLLTSV